MPALQEFSLTTTSGLKGSVFRRARFLDRTEMNRVRLSDGTEFEAPSSSLRVQPDGSFLYDDSEDAARPETGAPEPHESTEAAPPVAVARSGSGPEVLVDESLFSEEVSVERVPVNRIVDTPAEIRQEGDTTVFPVMEEVITVQKRLLLKEEVRITRKRTELREPRRVIMNASQARVLGADGREIQI
jgi:hypothetical protein